MTYAEIQDYLFSLRSIGSKFGLERMHALYQAAGRPGQGLPTLHIAGTNGKGSVCAMAEAVLRANGCRTGLFTSPHLVRLGERVQVNRVPLADAALVACVEELKPLCERIAQGDPQRHPTFFELMTVVALLHFERSGCDVVILETGLGGRLDSTNIVTPSVCAITSIGLDHQEILGQTLEAIAAEKAGIIKPGVPLVLGSLPPAARNVIVAHAARNPGVLVLETEAHFDAASLLAGDNTALPTPAPSPAPSLAASPKPSSAAVPEAPSAACSALSSATSLRPYPQTALCGDFQRRNAAVALLACEQLCRAHPHLPYSVQTALAALRSVQWAGRWQLLQLADGREVILDSSHNEEGARALEENLSRFVRERGVRPVVVTGVLGEARAHPLLAVVARYAQAVFLLAVAQPRACSAEQLRKVLPSGFGGAVQVSTVEALFAPGLSAGPALAADAFAGVPILVTGSIYLIGEVLTRLQGQGQAEAVGLQDKITA